MFFLIFVPKYFDNERMQIIWYNCVCMCVCVCCVLVDEVLQYTERQADVPAQMETLSRQQSFLLQWASHERQSDGSTPIPNHSTGCHGHPVLRLRVSLAPHFFP